MPIINVFCYGSNLLKYRIENRIGQISHKEIAQLVGYKLFFHKKSIDGSSKASILYTGDTSNIVWGTIIQITKEQKGKLDKFEGKGKGYDETSITVLQTNNIEIEVLTYVANSSTIDESVKPFDWYKALVILGALENKFPKEYINLLRKVEVISDSKFERSDENWGIIKSSLLSNQENY